LLAIGGAVLAILVLLAIILGVVMHQGGNNSTASTPAPTISASPTSSLGQPTSAFQATGCPFEADPTLVQNQQLSCGYVTVPENRSVKNGAKVKLAVAIFKAQQYINSVDPDPVIRLDGGPGGPSLSGWAQAINSNDYHALIFNHDVVMFDQRGTGYSTPSLNCPELISYQVASMGGGTAYEQAAHACYNRLTAQGIDLSSFNSLENAADVADIIHALGYQQMTLYGVSYGTRLALTTMRLYPSVVHAAVLDSVYPPNHNRADLTSDAQRVFTVLFQGCAKDPTCNKAYPNLQSVFYTLVDQLNAHPISFYTVDSTTNQQYTVTLAGDDLISWVFTALYATSVIPSIPQVIYQVKQHNYFQLANLYSQIMFDDTLSLGLFYSDECSEDWSFLTAQSIPQSKQGIEPHLAKVFGQEDEQQEYDICQFWKVNKAPDAQKQPVVSSIPTLITTGEYDPITPPANGQEAAKTLSHSYFFEFPGQGHGQLYSSLCSDQIISAFEDNPLVQPDGSCISLMAEPQFV
jgi:pimeloyl-ACP methyl ester carboxylesterase